MRGQRPLIIGMVFAMLWVLAHATWQVSQRQEESDRREPVAGPAEGPQPQRGGGGDQDQDVVNAEAEGSAEAEFARLRREMVRQQLVARDITDQRVLDAMTTVARHQFVPRTAVPHAYADGPLPIGHGQTISQPYIVALMTQLAAPRESSVALDVGTGSGYQAAVLAELCQHVYSIEIVEPLASGARRLLGELGYHNVTVRHGDGYRGWPEHAPFDLIIVAAAPEHVPQPLIDQLKPGGRLVIPVGKHYQQLLVLTKQADGSVRQVTTIPVAFVPMTGEAQPRPN